MSTRARATGWMRLRRLVLAVLGASLPLTLGSYSSPAAEFVPLGFLPGGNYSVAYGISADGSTVVGGAVEAFAWTAASGIVSLGELPGGSSSSLAYAVSADGSTIVGLANTAAGQEAFIWDAAHGMRPLDQVLASLGLDLTGWTLTNAWGISDDGKTLTGTGINPDGQHEGWIAVIPEPGTAWLLAVGLVPLVGASIRKRAKRNA